MDLIEYLMNAAKTADEVAKSMTDDSSKKTTIVHPQVWKSEEEAKQADEDWSVREQRARMDEQMNKLEKALNG